MTDALDDTAIARWRSDPAAFIETCLVNPETGKPFELLAAEREFLKHALRTDSDGRLIYTDLIYGSIKKSGKTGFAALFVLTLLLLLGDRFAEAYCAANDLEQAQSRVFELIKRIVECSPLLQREAKISAERITFPALGSTITALASNYASAAGSHPTVSVFDEIWGYTSERARRLYDELVPVPTRKISCRLIVTHAGFEGEGELLHQLYQRGMQQQQVGPDLYAGDGMLMFWSHVPIAPWQDERWLAQMRRSLPPNQYLRMIENRFVTSESSFIDMTSWDACVQPELKPDFKFGNILAGVDASTKRDSTALVAVTFDKKTGCVRLVQHEVFIPNPDNPINFEETVERVLLDWHRRYQLVKVLFDPYQMTATAQRLTKLGVQIEEYAQTTGNLTAATSNLIELISERRLVLYPNAHMRLAASRAITIENARGWRLDKLKQSHKIDVIVALSMACLAAVQNQNEYTYDRTLRAFDPNFVDLDAKPVPEQPPPEPISPRSFDGEWWRSQKGPTYASNMDANNRLRQMYEAVNLASRFGPPTNGRR